MEKPFTIAFLLKSRKRYLPRNYPLPGPRGLVCQLPLEKRYGEFGLRLWLKVMTDLKVRGVSDILIAVVDGLKGFPTRPKSRSINQGKMLPQF